MPAHTITHPSPDTSATESLSLAPRNSLSLVSSTKVKPQHVNKKQHHATDFWSIRHSNQAIATYYWQCCALKIGSTYGLWVLLKVCLPELVWYNRNTNPL